jgi:hypothetical protein
MRAPDSNTFISDAQWQAIHSILRHIGIDAETVRVGKGKDNDPLRSELDRWAAWYAKHRDFKAPTPAQHNAMIKEELAAVAAFRQRYQGDTLARYLADHQDWVPGGSFEVHSTIDHMLRALEPIEATLRAKLQPVVRGNRNAGKDVRDEYWFKLARIWQQSIAPLATQPPPRKSLVGFLIACTGDSKSAVGNFLDRLPKKARRILMEQSTG